MCYQQDPSCVKAAGEIQGDWYVSVARSSTSLCPVSQYSTINHNHLPSQQFPVEIQKILQYSWAWERAAVNTEVSAAATGSGAQGLSCRRKQGGTGCLSKVGAAETAREGAGLRAHCVSPGRP